MSAQLRSHQGEANSLASVSPVKPYRNLSATPIDDSGSGLTSFGALQHNRKLEFIGTDRVPPLVVRVDIVEPLFEPLFVFIGLFMGLNVVIVVGVFELTCVFEGDRAGREEKVGYVLLARGKNAV